MRELTVKIGQRRGTATVLALGLICGAAIFLRVYYPFDNVFKEGWVSFQSTDPWYHMRHVENLVHHFPQYTGFDPYGFYPSGVWIGTAPLFDFQIGLFAWIFGAGSPSKVVVETVGAYYPAILGALVPIPVYFMGRAIFGRGAGLLAAALIAILPGQFLVRTLLGYTDHHSAEIMFSTLTMLFLILAMRNATRKNISFASVRSRDWPALRRPLFYALLAGVSLGLYLLSWASGAFLVFIILAFILVQHVIDHLSGRPSNYLSLTVFSALLVALIIVAPFWDGYRSVDMQLMSLGVGVLGIPALGSISFLMTRRNIGRSYFVAATAALVGIGAAFMHLVDPGLFDLMVEKIGLTFNPTGTGFIAEVRGLSVSSAWDYFGPGLYMSLISLAVLLYLVVRKGAPAMTLLLVWSLTVLMAAIGQERFAAYLAVNVALLSAYLCWRLLEVAWFGQLRQKAASEGEAGGRVLREREMDSKITRRAQQKSRKGAGRRKPAPSRTGWFSSRHLAGVIALILVFFLVFYPNIRTAVSLADAPGGPNQDWHEALAWMKENTPEPFSDPAFYYDLYDEPTGGPGSGYPLPEYGVMSWWDYGYWITYIAHRVPNSHPGQRGIEGAARFFTAQDESSASGVLDRAGSKYVVVDLRTAIPTIHAESGVTGYFANIVELSGKDYRDYFEVYYGWHEGQFLPLLSYYPAYYETMAVRLYAFGGEEVVPENSTWVVSFVERTDDSGTKYKEMVDSELFATHEEAEEHLKQPGSENRRIINTTPFASPVPLERLEHFQLAYKSSTRATVPEARDVSWVQVFEYLP